MLPRFLASEIDPAAGTGVLDAEEAHHLTHVMRLGAGDEVAVVDGRGHEYRARVERAGRRGAVLRLIEPLLPAPEPAVRLTLAQAVLRGDKMDGVVRDATMMGVAAVQPIISEHTIGRGRGRGLTPSMAATDQHGSRLATDQRGSRLARDHAQDRWRRVAIASVKQCRRAVVPDVRSALTFDELIARDLSEVRLLLAEPSTRIEPSSLESLRNSPPRSATLLIGPEGGWSPAEAEAAVRLGWTPITLGRRTLRADAVAIVAIGVLQYLWGDL